MLRSISGYGERGPYSARKAYDMLIQAETGLASDVARGENAGRNLKHSAVMRRRLIRR